MKPDNERLRAISDMFNDCFSCPTSEAVWAIEQGYLSEDILTQSEADEMAFFEEAGMEVGQIIWNFTPKGLAEMEKETPND